MRIPGAGSTQSLRPKIDQGRLAPRKDAGFVLELWGRNQVRCAGRLTGPGSWQLIATAAATCTGAGGTATLASLVAIAAIDRTIAPWFEGNGCWLTAAGTDHGCPLCRS
jgi:hypothetical protein